MDTAVFLAVIALFGTVVGGLFKLIADAQKSQIALSESLNAVANTNQAIADATKKGADEAKERNGHLGELILQSTENTKTIAEGATRQILKSVQNVKEQHVDHQTVKTQD